MKSYFLEKWKVWDLRGIPLLDLLKGSIDWTGDHIDGKVIELMTQDYNTTFLNFLSSRGCWCPWNFTR